MSLAETFSPDWVSPPGETIKDALAYKNLSLEAFCVAIGMALPSVEDLLQGDLAIDVSIADRLATTLGSNRQFWMSRETFYRARREASPLATSMTFDTFAQQLPLKDMRSFGWFESFPGLSDRDAALAFFEDAPGVWQSSGSRVLDAVRFRTSFAHESNPAAVTAWLRQGVLQAREIECAPWDSKALEAAIPAMRALVRQKDPMVFFPKLVDICRGCGVAVVFVRTPKGCHASGATHFAEENKAVVQLSFRYRSDDHFWFTVFHELGHLILHPANRLFVEGKDYEPTEEEDEANRYSADVLVPEAFNDEIQAVGKDFKAVMRLARRIGISPGILVGQMQNRGLIRHEQLNFLKERYNWAALQAITP
ncbi:ImmA/IrrE family metallo-endopeptidase [Brevundimonas sp.]|uniref:ImmA/IrrE family metallo-endopeptidase n=1 Tax=Brevundimonas sp. TaxID=1871086 RepID=UPI0025C54457|nr:ImmA/IrrE family metallo-endopeptidase [Brevundimonas sp.]